MSRFCEFLGNSVGIRPSSSEALYDWSIRYPETFWVRLWEFCDIRSSERGGKILVDGDSMVAARWFPGSKLNFAENLLRRRDEHPAILFRGEDKVRRCLSFRDVYERSARFARGLLQLGITRGDRVAAFMPNLPESIIGMLGCASIGAVWSSCSPDFGTAGVVDRFGQIDPKILLCADGYFYRGKTFDCLLRAKEIASLIPSIQHTIVVPYVSENRDSLNIPSSIYFDECGRDQPADHPFAQLPFRHPLYVMFSSGTTGKPKCIVHSAGGTLLEHLKELVLHTDIGPADTVFYQTTCGWMMWNWLASSLATEASILLYDGYPFLNDGHFLFDIAEHEGVTVFGTNPKFLSSVEKEGIVPNRGRDLSKLRTILSTGSPLPPETYDFVYSSIKHDVCLSSISGGTDIIGCFALGSPWLPVYRGELQCRSLGLRVEVFDDSGKPVVGQKGELVCTAPFPSQPTGFWNDPDGAKYRSAYFSRFPQVWCHGDYVELTPRGGLIIYGRSDSVLNPGGIRIGTAEIYRQVEKLPQVIESVAIGQEWEGDVRVVLFVRLSHGTPLDADLEALIRTTIRENASPFHVPKKILLVTDIPRTRSGKITELAIREVIHGREVRNLEAIANPEALEQFRDREELR